MGCFPGPINVWCGERAMKGGKRPIKKGKRPIDREVLDGVGVDGVGGIFPFSVFWGGFS